MKTEIFKAYDIRGIYPDDLNEDMAYKIGRAFVKFLKCKNVVIGKDMRKSGNKLFEALSKGITEEGADVIEIGLCTTPMLYFCVGKYGYDSGIMITASHNPGIYNGFKLIKEKAMPISEDTGIKEIKKLATSDLGKGKGKGKITKKDFMKDYVKHVMKYSNITKKLKIVIDYGNGMGSLEVDNVLKDIDLNIIEMYKKPDGNFPNHEANPLKPENVKDLQKKVVEENADLGVAFDGDCDRVGFVDERGEIISGDMITAIISKVILEKNPNSTILYDLRSSQATKEAIEKNGGKAVKCRVGHTFIKKEMRKNNAIFAGELSFHFYFKDNYYTESGIGAILILLSLLSSTDQKISELIKPFKKYFPSGEINSEVEDKDAKIKEIAEKYKDAKNISWLDGVTVEYDDFWFNVRPSNTESFLRLNLEAKTKKVMEEKTKEVLSIIKS